MAKMVNVNREVEDAFYRYKMPLVQAKVEGRGNGIKTAIPNMVDVAKALDRPPSYTTKYLGVELGAQTQMYPADERYIVNGAFEADRFQELLDGFIKKFVLCEACGNPETVLKVTKKKEIETSCKACGYRGKIPLVHKLTTYIINNPPNEVAGGKKKGLDKAARRAAKNAKAQGKTGADAAAAGDAAGDAGSSIDVSAGTSRSNVAMREGNATIEVAAADDDDDDDDDWGDDASEEAQRKRATEQLGGASSFVATDDLDKSTGQRLELFDKFVAARVSAPKLPNKEIILEAERLDCKEKGSMVLVEHLWDVKDVKAAMVKHQALFQRFTFNNLKSQKYLTAAFEKLIETRQAELLAKVPVLFKTMYDLDLVDEEEFLRWAHKASTKNVDPALAKQIHAKAKPFIDWLQEADSDESEDEAVAFESAAETRKKEAEAAAAAAAETAAAPADDDELDDDDIDDI